MQCDACAAVWPVAGTILDLLEGPAERSVAERLRDARLVARAWDRNLRPLLAPMDPPSEILLVESLAAPRAGETVLDLACGTGLHAVHLAHRRELQVIGLDRSGPMLREAVHHLDEAGVIADLIRADPAALPFADATIDRVIDAGSLHLHPDLAAVLAEVVRVLRPGGCLVASGLLPERLRSLDRIEARAGVHRRNEAELRTLCEQAGLVDFERILLPPWIFLRARRA